MKKIFVLFPFLSVFVLTVISCEKEGELDTEYDSVENFSAHSIDSTVTDYPSAIDEYVANNYPGDTIKEVEINENGEYEVELSDENDTELLFDSEGNFIELIVDDSPNDGNSGEDEDNEMDYEQDDDYNHDDEEEENEDENEDDDEENENEDDDEEDDND